MDAFTRDREHHLDRPSSKDDQARRLADLESIRPHLVRVVLQTRAVCERVNSLRVPDSRRPGEAQLLLSAAVRDLEELDDHLDRARNPGT